MFRLLVPRVCLPSMYYLRYSFRFDSLYLVCQLGLNFRSYNLDMYRLCSHASLLDLLSEPI